MQTTSINQSRGILNPQAEGAKFQISRHLPSEDLSFFIQRYWIIDWDLRGQEPYVQETLPYPCINMVIEQGRSGIFGIERGKFARLLEETGHVFGIKFRPGAFYPFMKAPITHLSSAPLSLEAVFGLDGNLLEQAILSLEDKGKRIEIVERFFRARLPEQDQNITLINEVVDGIVTSPEITRVDDLVERFNLSKRTLQRLFKQYVGVSPKWVIQRYRLQEVAERLTGGEAVCWPDLAAELGYSDQAHFIKDFKNIVGKTPAKYASSISAGS